jgi:mono/diheme cytochrome c family protein
MVDFVGLAVLVLLVVLFGYLVRRAWGSKNAILKWVGLVLAGLVTLLFTLVLIGAVIGTVKLNQNYNADHPVAEIKVAGTPEQVARGAKIAQVCGCHLNQGKLPLSGNDFFGGPGGGPPLGTLWARNLTPGGELKDWSDGEIIRAVREGVHKNGRSLIIMPAEVFRSLSDDDVQALVAYLRSQPAVTPDAPPNNLNVLGAVVASGIMGNLLTVQPHISQPVIAPPEGATAEYGQYLVNIIGCRQCHGANLAGGKLGGGPPPGPNLTSLVPTWSQEQFDNTIHTGVDPTGHTLNPEEMPWKEISVFATDDDLKAIYAYLHGLPTLPNNPKQ